MRKLIDACAIFAAVGVASFIGTGLVIYVNRNAIVENVQERIQERVKEAVLGSIDLPIPSGLPGIDGPGSNGGGSLPALPGGFGF